MDNSCQRSQINWFQRNSSFFRLKMASDPVGYILMEDSSQSRDQLPEPPREDQESLGGLELLLTLDSKVTQLLAVCSSTGNRFQRLLKTLFLTLEVSGHGLPWFLLCGVLLAGNLLTGEQYLWVYSFDLFAILVLDIVLVAPMKIFFRRPRPSVNTVNKGNVLFSVSTVDNYAFPSGHASRSVAVAAFFCYMPPFNSRTHLWYIWALSVSVSRIMMGRHHVLDVIVGTMAGLFVFEIVRQTCLLI